MSRDVSIGEGNLYLSQSQYEAVQALVAKDPAFFEENGFGSDYGWDWEKANDGSGLWTISFAGEGTDEDMDQKMFDRLAPVIPAGLYISMFDEYGDHWRYYFDGTHCHLQEGKVVYDA